MVDRPSAPSLPVSVQDELLFSGAWTSLAFFKTNWNSLRIPIGEQSLNIGKESKRTARKSGEEVKKS
ncbi:hypothetical protein NDU88_005335 [Pleurodeles waltl]|uniref:Uncharacterized protein n=1 Tax=Pleurodeles waltl TaxID=8319 RepID=A0AAV7L4A6_PLEWA|nr:hypothetical protein NDU88_005335 [Pleurodeles waltl]